jgi:hypothetical protein
MAKTTMAEDQKNADNPGYETTDADIKPLAQTGIFVTVLLVFSFISMIVLFKVFAYYQPLLHDNRVSPLATSRIVSNEPRLQVDPPAQKLTLDSSESETLSSYGWVDPSVKVARIPIDRAIELVSTGKVPLIPTTTATE